jgi:hypothetical protein
VAGTIDWNAFFAQALVALGKGVLTILGRLIQPAYVLMYVARLDDALEVALLAKMRPSLSNTTKKRLFDGPLGNFATKIDLAYGLSIFDDEIYSDLKVIKDIRNIFAHPEGPLTELSHFSNPRLVEACKKFNGYDSSIHPINLFVNKVAGCILAISNDENDLKVARAVLSQPVPKSKPLIPPTPPA